MITAETEDRPKLELPEKYRCRITLSVDEVCEVIGCGRSFFYTRVAPEISLIHRGRRTLVPVAELLTWLGGAA